MCEGEKISSNKIKNVEFVSALWERFGKKEQKPVEEDLWLYGRKCGWLEEQDQLWAERPIEKRNAARIVHEFLRIEYGIPDERDWGKAKKLEDLYHCRVCAKHVAQVYIKGLMQAQTEKRFGLLSPIQEVEMQNIFERMQEHIEKMKRDC